MPATATPAAAVAPRLDTRTPPRTPSRTPPRTIIYDPHRQPSGTAAQPTGRAKLAREACSTTWRDDLNANRDRDYTGRLTGPGTRKVRCRECGKACPPQYVSTGAGRAVCATCVENDRAPRDASERKKPGRVVPAVPVLFAGVDRVALERVAPEPARPAVTLERVGYGPSATYESTVEQRPTGSLAVAMSSAHCHFVMDTTPTGGTGLPDDATPEERAAYEADERELAAELAAYQAAVHAGMGAAALAEWVEDDESREQEYRRAARRAKGAA